MKQYEIDTKKEKEFVKKASEILENFPKNGLKVVIRDKRFTFSTPEQLRAFILGFECHQNYYWEWEDDKDMW